MIVVVFALVALFMVLYVITLLAPHATEWRVEGHWRPIVCEGGRLDQLYHLEWSSRRYQRYATVFQHLGDDQSAQLYSDLAHIRALEERFEAERFTQRPHVRAIVRVLS